MTLTTSAFFWASCAAVLIPILIHWLWQGKPKPVVFPAVHLIQPRMSANRRRFRFRQITLLLLRAGLLLLFGLLLARPIWRMTGQKNDNRAGHQTHAAVLLFDTSLRMAYEQNGHTRLDEAKKLGLALLETMAPETRVAIFDTYHAGNAFQIDHLAAREQMERLETAPQRFSLAESAAEAIRLLSAESGDKELVILSDRTAAGWPVEFSLAHSLRNADGSLRVFFADLAPETVQNTALSDVTAGISESEGKGEAEIGVTVSALGQCSGGILELACQPILSGGEKTTLTESFAEPDFTGPRAAENRLNETASPQSQTEVKIKKKFRLHHLAPGLYQGTITKTPPDPLPIDDTISFTFEIRPPKKLLFAAAPPCRERALFLRTAVALSEQEQGRPPYEIETIAFDRLEETPLDTAQTAALFLLDPPQFSAAFLARLQSFVSDGGGVGLFLGRDFSENQPSEFAQLIGGVPLRQVNIPEGTYLLPVSNASPLLAGFGSGTDAAAAPWSQVPVYRYWRFDWKDDNPWITALCYADGQPALLERSLGRGRLVLATTPFSELASDAKPWNHIATGDHSWLFLVLADGIANTLTGREDSLNKVPFETVAVSAETRKNLAVIPPDRKPIPLSLPESESRLTFTGTGELGSYQIIGGEKPKIIAGFSVNPRTEEMRLEPVSCEKLQERFGKTKLEQIGSAEKLEMVRHRLGPRIDLYSLLAFLFGILLVMELLAGSRLYGNSSP